MIPALNADLLFELPSVDFRFYFNIVYISRKLSAGKFLRSSTNSHAETSLLTAIAALTTDYLQIIYFSILAVSSYTLFVKLSTACNENTFLSKYVIGSEIEHIRP